MENTLLNLKNQALALIQEAKTKEELESLKVGFLGRKSRLHQAFAILDKAAFGRQFNEVKTTISDAISTRIGQISGRPSEWIDPTIPGKLPKIGHLHPITLAIEEIQRIFEHIGFTRVRYPEADWEWYVFEALNMPADHPARDEWETIFIDRPADQKFGKMVLTPHTSNGQVREMERVGKPPVRMLNIGKCYRRQQDATHTIMFHQFEGLVIDKGISIPNLKGTLDYFGREFFGPGVKSRIRPFHFQFTEPSFEVDFTCTACKGRGCRFCKSGWVEVGGAGMVHPHVLSAGKIDPRVFSGFAFGWGVERVLRLKPGINLADIRLLYSTNQEFLNQL